MHRLVYIFALVTAISLLQGCALLNSTDRLWDGDTPFFNRATIVFGVDGQPRHKTFAVILDEYNLEKQTITGNCWRYNKAQALVSVDDGLPQYFAFDVPAGYYVYHETFAAINPHIAFVVPKGGVIYLGTFVYSSKLVPTTNKFDKRMFGELIEKNTVELHRDLEKDKNQIFIALPELPKNIELADTVPAKPAKGFICGI